MQPHQTKKTIYLMYNKFMRNFRLHHIAITTPEPEGLSRFYETILNQKRCYKRENDSGLTESVWLQTDGTILMFERSTLPVDSKTDEFPDKKMGYHLLSFQADFNTTDELESWLTSKSVEIEHRSNYTIYFRDPDGNRIGFTVFSKTDFERLTGNQPTQ